MPKKFLTPITLWKNFDDTLPLDEEIVSEQTENGVTYKEVYFLGRKTQYGRVKIYAKYYTPADLEEYPAVMVLFEAGFPSDYLLVEHLLKRGLAVLCVDYCGDMHNGRHTIYPRDIDYANFLMAGRHIDYVDESAKETSWYEWAAVARYAARYLLEQKGVTKAGMLGLRTGGEVLWKIAPYADMQCFISVCSAGWLAYRDIEKFGADENSSFDEEQHRFIAGIDSQSYAPHVKCPVMILSAINDKKSNYDRVYDTFQQINPQVEKAILYSAHGNGLIGRHSFANIDLFLDKYLKGRSVYLSKPVKSSVVEEDGELKVNVIYDDAGEPEEYGMFYTEKLSAFRARDWTRVVRRKDPDENAVLPLSVYEGCSKVLIYTFVRYSNGFSITSKIQEVSIDQIYRNSRKKSKVLYSSQQGIEGFSVFRRRAGSIADCFMSGENTFVELMPGYGGILGVCCDSGLISYRVSEPRYEPSHGAAFSFDAYCEQDGVLNVTFYCDEEEMKGYTCSFQVSQKGKWKNFVCDVSDFKSDFGGALSDFTEVVSVVFASEEKILINNVIWL